MNEKTVRYKSICTCCRSTNEELLVTFAMENDKPFFLPFGLEEDENKIIMKCEKCGTTRSHELVKSVFYDLYEVLHNLGYKLRTDNMPYSTDIKIFLNKGALLHKSFIIGAFRNTDWVHYNEYSTDDPYLAYHIEDTKLYDAVKFSPETQYTQYMKKQIGIIIKNIDDACRKVGVEL